MSILIHIIKIIVAVALVLGLGAALAYAALCLLAYMFVQWVFNPNVIWLYLAGACTVVLVWLVLIVRRRKKERYYHV